MSKSCIWRPGVNKDMSGEPSALHSDLVEYTGSRPLANAIWAATKVKGVIDTANLEYDENGEPTLESLNKVVNLKKLVGRVSLLAEKRQAGAETRNGEPILYPTLEEALIRASEFNSTDDEVIAYPVRSGDKYKIKVEYKNDTNETQLQQAKFNNQLNNTLIGMMRNLGFTVVYSDDGVTNVFDPENASETADKLKAIIRIARGELGEEAFPEEFAHFMIDGLTTHPLVSRILKYLRTDGVVERILGDEFAAYNELYNGDELRLRKEAAGKLLARYIKGEDLEVNDAPRNLLQRIWSYIKGLFSRGSIQDIDDAINRINKDTLQLASQIKDSSALPYFDRTSLMSADALYKVETKISNEEKLAEKALEIASKRLKIVQSRSKSGKYKDIDVKKLKDLQNAVNKKNYRKSYVKFLKDTIAQLTNIRKKLEQASNEGIDANNLTKLKRLASALRQVKEFSDGYTDIVNTMRRMPELVAQGEFDLDVDDANSIADLANEVSNLINSLNGNYVELRNRAVYEFLKVFWGEDKTWDIGKNKGKKLTLTMIMQEAAQDINAIDRWISSLASASDPMLGLIDKAVKVTRIRRDMELEELIADIRGAHRELTEAGYNTDFIYMRDEKGVPTGWLLSNVDYKKFYKERYEFKKSLMDDESLEPYQRKARLEAWERERLEEVPLIPGRDDIRSEVRPIASKPGDPYYIDRLSKLAPAQRKFYDEVMKAKALLEANLPMAYTKLHKAVQIRNDVIEGLSQASSTKQAVKMILGNFTDGMIRRVDDTDYGEYASEDDEIEDDMDLKEVDTRKVVLDFSGKPIQKLPVYYTRWIKDKTRLSTDFTGTLMAYAAAALDYAKMSEIVDVLELTRDFVRDRDVVQTSGNKTMREVFRVLRKDFNQVYKVKGGNIADRLDDYMDAVVYGRHKLDEGVITIPTNKKNEKTGKYQNVEIGVSKLLDSLKNYTGAVGLGLNTFSAISNITVGKLQQFIDGVCGQYFNMKNMTRGVGLYYTMLPSYLGELTSTNKSNKLGLLIDKYDALEEFFSGMKDQTGRFKGTFSRMVKHMNLYILNNIGEHNLHCTTMLAMLDRYKVKVDGKETSIVDAWKVREVNNSYELVLKDGTTDKDGNQLFTESLKVEREQLLKKAEKKTKADQARLAYIDEVKKRTDNINIDLRLKIGRVNQSLNGAFNEADRGAINRRGYGRLIMQFRQWMPEHYNRRFAKAYYDVELGEFREGYYRTIGRFMTNVAKDLRHFKFDVATHWRALSENERRNIMRAITETSIFLALSKICGVMGKAGWKDKDSETWKKHVFYHLLRMKLETGASFPWPPSFIKNVTTLLQSPAAAISKFNNIGGLFEFWKMGEEITSGRYKGWTQYEKNLYNVIPLYSNIRKVVDMKSETYMFNIFD